VRRNQINLFVARDDVSVFRERALFRRLCAERGTLFLRAGELRFSGLAFIVADGSAPDEAAEREVGTRKSAGAANQKTGETRAKALLKKKPKKNVFWLKNLIPPDPKLTPLHSGTNRW